MEIFTAIIVAISSLLGVFVGVLLQFYFSRKKDYEANLLQLELQAYIDFMKAAAELKNAQAENDSVKVNFHALTDVAFSGTGKARPTSSGTSIYALTDVVLRRKNKLLMDTALTVSHYFVVI